MCLRSLEEAAADQVAEQMAHEQAVASGSMRDVPEARSIIAQVSGSRSGERNGHEEDDESMSDDSGSELPQPLSAGNAGPLPRTFDEFRRHWGTRLKDVAAHYGVPESGLSKVLLYTLGLADCSREQRDGSVHARDIFAETRNYLGGQ